MKKMLKFDIEQNFEESYLLADDEHKSLLKSKQVFITKPS